MYKGKKTCFYNGEKLYDRENGEYLVYSEEEQNLWEAVIVLPGVEVIPEFTFGCNNIETVIMNDTVKRIEEMAFAGCENLFFVRLSRNLEYIGDNAFCDCTALTSIFIPPLCREIGKWAFESCDQLIIFNVSRQTQIGENAIVRTALIKASPLQVDGNGWYDGIAERVNEWIKNINGDDDQYALHRACSSYNPLTDVLYQIVKRQGLRSFKKKNEIGITPLQYLEANPFAEDIDQCSIVKRYVLEMMGEAV
ncbi:hypothetical protein CTEN210_06770 [Chaetoceros tenuissimus]|uniref:Leucine-rich repeat domain-containing protein n=1 Tax=Chaetoceros tenuissimus TaxID=426638 RepID=A0AAD3CTE8_9STRA|nr:hypothetical protein CTEN210_06770 [Chaetoceros tenuissimus]